ncbi:hypothetical protein BDR26DRAFT_903351 [Obelidium mucronatum]|nr:hypothetical protein BDR26DRAFT_903351 [Obelidium mucronatum]
MENRDPSEQHGSNSTAEQIVQQCLIAVQEQHDQENEFMNSNGEHVTLGHLALLHQSNRLTQQLVLQVLAGQSHIAAAVETKAKKTAQNPLCWEALGSSLHIYIEKEARKNLFMNAAEATDLLDSWMDAKPLREQEDLRINESDKRAEYHKLCLTKSLKVVREKRNLLADRTRTKIRSSQEIPSTEKLNLKGTTEASRFKASFIAAPSVVAAKFALISNRLVDGGPFLALVKECHHGTSATLGKLTKHEIQFVFGVASQYLDGEGLGDEAVIVAHMTEYGLAPCVEGPTQATLTRSGVSGRIPFLLGGRNVGVGSSSGTGSSSSGSGRH